MYNNSYYKYSGMRWWYRNLWWLQITLPCLIILSVAGALIYNWHRQNANQQRQDEYMEQMWTWWRGNPPQLDPDLDEKTAAWRAIRQKQDDSSFPISHEKKLLIVKHWEYLISGMSIDEVQRLHNLLQDKKPDETVPNVIDPQKFKAPWDGTLTVDSSSAANENSEAVQNANNQKSSDDTAETGADAAKIGSDVTKTGSDETETGSDWTEPDAEVAKTGFDTAKSGLTSIQQQSAASFEDSRPEKSDSSNELKEESVEAAVDKAVERMFDSYGLKPSNQEATMGNSSTGAKNSMADPETTSGSSTDSAQEGTQNKSRTAEKLEATNNPSGIKEFPEDSSADSILTQEYIPVDWKL